MFYSVELQMAGVILLTAMAVGGISLWIKRRKLEKESVTSENDVSENLWCFFNLDDLIFKKELDFLIMFEEKQLLHIIIIENHHWESD